MNKKNIFIIFLFGILHSSCISTGKDMTLVSAGIEPHPLFDTSTETRQSKDTILLNANNDTIFIFFRKGFFSYHGPNGMYASKCCPSDSTGYYYPFLIDIYSPNGVSFELCSFTASDENGSKVPFVAYYTVPIMVNESCYLTIDTIPFTLTIGKTLGKIDSRGKLVKYMKTQLGFEICKAYRDLQYLEIHFKIKFDDLYKEYYAVYKRKRWMEFRPKFWTIW